MKKKIFALFLSAAALASGAPALASGAEETPPPWTALYENASAVTDDLTYTNRIFENGEGLRVESFAVETGPGGSVRPIVATADSLYEAMTPEELTAAAKEKGLHVLAAVNADFFYSSAKLPLGGVIEDGEYITDTDNENLFVLTDSGAFFAEKPYIAMTLRSAAGAEVKVDHLNKIRNNTGGIFLYTAAYHPEHTATTRTGWAVRFKVLSGRVAPGSSVELCVEEILPECADIAVGEGYMALTCPADGPYPDAYRKFAVGDRVTLTVECADERLLEARWATGCGDLLVEDGEITDSAGWDRAIADERHPRTAVGVKPDGSVVALVVDGRYSAYSAGATLNELAAELRRLGCAFAVNMDGGGSSAMLLKSPGSEGCSVVNRPSDGSTRRCSTYLLFVSDEVSDGVADALHLEEDGAFILAGSSALLTPLATDRAGDPAAVPEDVVLTARKGTVEDGVYTAGEEAGEDTITLESADGAVWGTATLHVTDKLDSLTVTALATGAAPALFEMEPGTTVDLAVSGAVLRRDVLMDASRVQFSVSGGVGEITPDGSFTALASSAAAEGEISVTAGGVTVTLPVSLNVRYSDVLNHWASDYVSYLFDRGVLLRTEDGLYGPDEPMKRREFALMLWRAMGSPVLEGESIFTDVSPESEYFEAVKWGNLIGLIYGTDYGVFSPDDSISREQAFTLVYRLLTILRRELPEADPAVLDLFPDGGGVSPYARDAVATLVSAGVIVGSDGLLLPQSGITRAELCKVTCEAVLNWTPPEA